MKCKWRNTVAGAKQDVSGNEDPKKQLKAKNKLAYFYNLRA